MTQVPTVVLVVVNLTFAIASMPSVAAQAVPDDGYRPAFPEQSRAPAPKGRTRLTVETLASGLVQPWSLAFLPDGRMLVTERPGRLRVIDEDGTLSPPVAGVPAVRDVRGRGLADLVLDPDFTNNRRVYLSYFAPPEGEPGGPVDKEVYDAWTQLPASEREANPFGFRRVARARLSADETRLEDLEILLDSGGRRLTFAPDGTLFVSTWAHRAFPTSRETGYDSPQRLSTMGGKIFRIHPDGTVPRDNPWVNVAGAHPEIFARGFRDVEGLTVHPETGQLWTVEHGPRGGDELNAIRRGGNHGYPVITYGTEYSGEPVGEGRTAQEGMEQPVYFWKPSIAPSGLLFYTGELFPEWRGDLFVGAMAGKHLVRLVLEDQRVQHEEKLLVELEQRIRDVRQGPEGALYLLTAEDEGRVLRLTPRE